MYGIFFWFIVFGILSVIVAASKGFKPAKWLYTFGPIGLIVVAFLSSAKKKDISEEERSRRVAKADKVGGVLLGSCIVLSILFLILVFSAATRI